MNDDDQWNWHRFLEFVFWEGGVKYVFPNKNFYTLEPYVAPLPFAHPLILAANLLEHPRPGRCDRVPVASG